MKKFWTPGHVGNIRLLVKDAVHLQVLNACAKLWASHCLILFLHFLAFLGIGVLRFELRTTCSFQPATYGVTFQAPMRPHPSYRMPPWSPQRYTTQSCSLKLAISCLSIFVDNYFILLLISSNKFSPSVFWLNSWRGRGRERERERAREGGREGIFILDLLVDNHQKNCSN